MKTKLIVLIVAVGVGCFIAGRYSKPAKIETEFKEVKVKDEEYTAKAIEEYKRTHKEEFTVVRHHTKTLVKPCSTPPTPIDGCKPPCAVDCNSCPTQVLEEKDIEVVEHDSTTTTEKDKNTVVTETNHETTETTAKKTEINASRVFVTAYVGVKARDLSLIYGGSVNYPILGPLSVGVWGQSDLSFGGVGTLRF